MEADEIYCHHRSFIRAVTERIFFTLLQNRVPRVSWALSFLRAALSNAGVQRRRTAPNEGVPLASLSPAQNILIDFTVPV